MRTDELVIEQLRQGKDAAYRHVFDTYYDILCKVAERFVGDRFQAESIVGDVIFRLWELRGTLDEKLRLRSYLVRSVRNSCLNYLNTKYSQTEIPFSLLFPVDEEPNFNHDKWTFLVDDEHPLGILLEKELEGEIHEAIERLPDESRLVFKKSRFENKTYYEISSEIGISVNTVKYHIKKALAFLVSELEDYLIVILLFLTMSRYP